MTNFSIRLANRVIGISAIYDSTRNFCNDYLTEDLPELTVTVTQADVEYERNKSIREAQMEGIAYQNFSDSYLETLAVYRKIADEMLSLDTLLYHGSAIAVDGQCYLFTATSGTGKSTHTRLWRETFGERAVMVNDDKPLLSITDAGVFACGTPWNGKHFLGNNVVLPLKAICILQRGEENRIHPITATEALPMLLQQSYRPSGVQAMVKYMDLVDKLAKGVSFYLLQCNMDPQAALISYEAMSAGRKEE